MIGKYGETTSFPLRNLVPGFTIQSRSEKVKGQVKGMSKPLKPNWGGLCHLLDQKKAKGASSVIEFHPC